MSWCSFSPCSVPMRFEATSGMTFAAAWPCMVRRQWPRLRHAASGRLASRWPWIEQHFRAHQRHGARGFGKPLVPAYADAQCANSRVPLP